jgi:cation diffusion facilitator CzcD-associated flavoprotein CzcO
MSSVIDDSALDAVAATSTPAELAGKWLASFETAARAGDVEAVVELFGEDGWWRDLLAVTWDLRTMHGADAIRATAGNRLALVELGDFLIDDRIPAQSDDGLITAAFTFRTRVALGRGIVRLRQQAAESESAWKAWTLLTEVDALIDFPEMRTTLDQATDPEYTVARAGRESWHQRRAREREFIDTEPDVLVVGAGHAGLTIAARLQHLGVSTLISERTARVGDVWRNRYNSLSLHDSKFFGNMPYLPFPDNWPVFSPKDALGDWFEAYVWMLQLNVWTSSEVISATYDDAAQRWDVQLRRDDELRVIHPRHVVFASGVHAGDPGPPQLPGLESFQGVAVHSSSHRGGAELKDKRVIVVGTGASGNDVAQDACESGASQITFVQRSPSYVMSLSGVRGQWDTYSEASLANDDADVLTASMPWKLFLQTAGPRMTRMTAERDAEKLTALNRAGYRTTLGHFDSGVLGQVLYGGGYYIDKGCCQLVIDGKIKMQAGEVSAFTEHGVIFSDGSEMDADVVVFATGFIHMRDAIRPILGEESIDRLSPVWGLDEEGEINGLWRPTGHPKLWFTGGGFWQTRVGSKLLALQIKASQEGLIGD